VFISAFLASAGKNITDLSLHSKVISIAMYKVNYQSFDALILKTTLRVSTCQYVTVLGYFVETGSCPQNTV